MTGQTVTHYRVSERIGAGGMGIVYAAEDTRLGRRVALKFLPEELSADPASLERLLREARAISSLNHPHICTLHDIGEHQGRPFLVLELLEGEELRKRIGRPISPGILIDFAIQIVGALQAAHAKGIIHRDIKPSNIFVTAGDHIKIMDFGLAKQVSEPTGRTQALTQNMLTSPGATVGTVAYMSPEQARGLELDARTDLFSFGVVLYELCAGVLPFPGNTHAEIFTAILSQDPVPPSRLGSKVPALDSIILKALEKDRERRYQTASELLTDLKGLQQGIPSAPSRPAIPMSRGRWRMAVGVAAAAIAGAILWHRYEPKPAERSEWIQVTNLPDSATQPSLSPDGRMLTFIRGPGTFYTNGQIYLKMLPDGEPQPLTRDDTQKMIPVFSPDGSRIAYTVYDSGKWDTWVTPITGGAPQLWLPNATGLSWIDKGRLLFSEIKTGWHMGLVTAGESRTAARDVYLPPSHRGMVHRSYVSPDAKWVLLAEMDNGQWLPCRLVPAAGTPTGRPVGPPDADCTYAAWSPDGKWMYLNAHAGGAPHIWRQRFPNGEPKQITSGPMEEEGIAIAPDGRSLITSAGFRKSAVWIHDAGGERQISLEGYAFQPKFTADGRKLCYRVLKGGYSYANPSELWIADLDSGRSRQLMPGLPVYGYFGYDISPDGTLVVGESRDPHGKPRLWIAPIDRRSPPEQIQNIEGRTPLFGPKGEIFFNLDDRSTGQLRVFPCEISRDGTGFRKVSEQPIAGLRSVSPDGRWLIAFTNGGTMALPVQGGTPVRIWGEDARVKWAPNGKAVFLSPGNVGAPSSGIERKTYALPLLPDQVLPMGASGSFRSQKELAAFRGVKVLDSPDAAPGLTPEVYAFVRETMQRNLYRVPLR